MTDLVSPSRTPVRMVDVVRELQAIAVAADRGGDLELLAAC